MMPPKFKPMKGDPVKLHQVKFPVYASYKLDGVRCVNFDGVAYSNSLKLIPNKHVQEWAKKYTVLLDHLDGELCVGSVTEPGLLRRTTSVVMSHDKDTPFTFYVFDEVGDGIAQKRIKDLEGCASWHGTEFIEANIFFVEQVLINNLIELLAYEKKALDAGYEGIMLKSPTGKYKFGRASVKSAELLKRKPFVDREFQIVGWEPMYHNANEATINELGRTARSTAKAGLEIIPDLVGSLICQVSDTDKRTFNVGTGFDNKTREDLYNMRDELTKYKAKIKYFEQGKIGGIPELPVFLDLRYPEDT